MKLNACISNGLLNLVEPKCVKNLTVLFILVLVEYAVSPQVSSSLSASKQQLRIVMINVRI